MSTNNLCADIYSNFNHNNPELEIPQIPINWGKSKNVVVYPYNAILLRNKKITSS